MEASRSVDKMYAWSSSGGGVVSWSDGQVHPSNLLIGICDCKRHWRPTEYRNSYTASAALGYILLVLLRRTCCRQAAGGLGPRGRIPRAILKDLAWLHFPLEHNYICPFLVTKQDFEATTGYLITLSAREYSFSTVYIHGITYLAIPDIWQSSFLLVYKPVEYFLGVAAFIKVPDVVINHQNNIIDTTSIQRKDQCRITTRSSVSNHLMFSILESAVS